MNILKKDDLAFKLMVLAFCVYAAAFIFKTSFVIDGERYFSLFDDMMICMKYAENLANGHGMVWNPTGERVEGYTQPLWIVFMSIFHLFPIPMSKISLFIQLSGAVFLAINLFFVKKIADSISNGSKAVALGAVFLTAFYLPLNSWSLLGVEVSLLTLITSICLWLTLQCVNNKKFSPWLYILLGIGTFVRPDMSLPFFSIGLFLIVADPENRRKNLFFGSAVLLICIVSQTALRLWYYDDMFPNTYYLKLTGYPIILRLTRGLFVFVRFIWEMNLVLLLIPFSILFFRRDKPILLLFAIIPMQIIYSIYIGGDAWEDSWGGSNRFVSIVMPSFFILFSYSLSYFCRLLIDNTGFSEKTRQNIFKYSFIFLLILSSINFNSIYGPKALKELLLLKNPLAIDVDDHKPMVELALMVRKLTTPQAKIAVSWAGTTPYFAKRHSIDGTGKNDKWVARTVVDTSKYPEIGKYFYFRPGDNKKDLDYTVNKLKPDVLVLFGIFWHNDASKQYTESKDYKTVILQEEKLVGNKYGYHFSFRKDSPNVLWNEIERLRK